MSTLKKLLIAAVCCAVAGHCSVMYGMNDGANDPWRGLFATSSQPTTLPHTEELFRAIVFGNAKEVSRLIGIGANVNATVGRIDLMDTGRIYRYDTGMTALMCAAGQGNLGIVKELLKQGANVNAQDKVGYTALMYALSLGPQAAIRAVQANYGQFDRKSRLEAENDYINVARALIQATKAVDNVTNNEQASSSLLRSSSFQPSLHYGGAGQPSPSSGGVYPEASGRGGQAEEQASSSLPPKESSLNIKDRGDNTALHHLIEWAITFDDCPDLMTRINPLLRIMLDAGADPTIKNFRGYSPIDYAQGKVPEWTGIYNQPGPLRNTVPGWKDIYNQLPALKNYVEKRNQMIQGDSLPEGSQYITKDLAGIVSGY